MYEVVYEDELFWITYKGRKLVELGGFIEPVSPKIIIEEMRDEV